MDLDKIILKHELEITVDNNVLTLEPHLHIPVRRRFIAIEPGDSYDRIVDAEIIEIAKEEGNIVVHIKAEGFRSKKWISKSDIELSWEDVDEDNDFLFGVSSREMMERRIPRLVDRISLRGLTRQREPIHNNSEGEELLENINSPDGREENSPEVPRTEAFLDYMMRMRATNRQRDILPPEPPTDVDDCPF